MQSSFIKNQIKHFSSGTTVATITIKKAKCYKTPLPPLNEQKCIVDKIERLFGTVDVLNAD